MLDSARILPQVLDRYALDVVRHEHVRTSENVVLKLLTGDGRAFALRIRKTAGADPAPILSELAVLRDFGAQSGAIVPIPLPARDGRLCCPVTVEQETFLCAIFSWVPGVHVAADRIAPAQMAAMARAAAQLHAFSATYRPPADFVRPVYDDAWFFGSGTWSADPEFVALLAAADTAYLREANRIVRDRLRLFPRDPDTFGLIHYDLHVGNFLFENDAAHLIDFDECGFGHYLFDLAHVLFEFIEDPRFPDFRAVALAEYAAGRSGRAIPAADLQLFLALQGIAYVNWLHRIFRRDGNADAAAGWIPRIVRRLRTVLA